MELNYSIGANPKKRKIIQRQIKNNNLSTTDIRDIRNFYNSLNQSQDHFFSKDDICTPIECVEKMIDYIPKNFWNKNVRILDPCAGNGNFGSILQLKTNKNQIFHLDINQKRINNLVKILNPNLKNVRKMNFFELKNEKYDLIIGNPPYSGNGNKNTSLSNKFIEHSIDLLKNEGYLCFITPNNWMSYNKSKLLEKMLKEGNFLIIDNDCKKYFKNIGSSFVIFLWQKKSQIKETLVKNNYLNIKDEKIVTLRKDLKFIPLYCSQEILDISTKIISDKENGITYRCDLHNFTKKKLLNDYEKGKFKYRTIHTPNQTRWSLIKQDDIYNNYNVIIPLSMYFKPYIETKNNVTQSVAYKTFVRKKDAQNFNNLISQPIYKLIVHLTRFGNFNNLRVIKHLKLNLNGIDFTKFELEEIEKLYRKMKY